MCVRFQNKLHATKPQEQKNRIAVRPLELKSTTKNINVFDNIVLNMSGPQSDRDRVWIGKHAELSREREDLSIDRGSEKQV